MDQTKLSPRNQKIQTRKITKPTLSSCLFTLPPSGLLTLPSYLMAAAATGFVSSLPILIPNRNPRFRSRRRLEVTAEAMVTERMGIKVEKDPPESRLAELGVRSWPKWGCPPSKLPWEYTSKETCYLLEGKVKVYPDGRGDDFVEIGSGDLVEFPKGMKCTWDVAVAVDKHYNFE